MKASNPFYNASTEKFIRDWRSTVTMIAVRDARIHQTDPLLGGAILPLHTLLTHRGVSYFTDSFPLVGSIGYGCMRLSLTFRSDERAAAAPLASHRVRRRHSRHPFPRQRLAQPAAGPRRMSPNIPHATREGENDGTPQGRVASSESGAELKPYASCLIVEFRKHKHKMGLGSDRTPAFALLWLKDLPDKREVEMPLGVHKNLEGAPAMTAANCTGDGMEKVGEITIKLRLWPELSGYRQGAVDKDVHLEA
ncbi:hypothetical protein DXG01_008282 [Tephrocybe rancida]|nr:hypothetical protein DXG01_008282 [Tephrocybe rancida]